MGTDSRTHIVYETKNLKQISNFEMKCKDDSDNDITYFYDTRLSYDGSYLVAGDSMNRYIFDVHGKFLRR